MKKQDFLKIISNFPGQKIRLENFQNSPSILINNASSATNLYAAREVHFKIIPSRSSCAAFFLLSVNQNCLS